MPMLGSPEEYEKILDKFRDLVIAKMDKWNALAEEADDKGRTIKAERLHSKADGIAYSIALLDIVLRESENNGQDSVPPTVDLS